MMPQSWIGKTIGGRYQIEALIGQGGMSAVYRATDPNLRRLVAIKLIHTHLSADPNFVGRFKEEATAVARLRHPNIVQVHDFNVDGETYYMVMEYLVGETLQARLKRLNTAGRQMPLDEALRLCIQLCEAAGYAHDHELVHRDIKPANVMLNIQGQAILMDFGIVKIIGGDYHTATGATVGTAMYMSPEQIRTERVDERADIYSLGVTLYEMLSGRPPYVADSALTLMMMVLNDPLPDLREFRTDIPNSLLEVVNKALAKETTARFQKMADMASALRQVQAELTATTLSSASAKVGEGETELATSTVPSPTAEHLPEAEPAEVLQAGQSGETPSSDYRQPPVPEAPPIPTLQDGTPETVPARSERGASRTRSISRLATRRVLLITAGLLLLAILVAAGLLYLNTTKPPGVQLAPINHPTDPINAGSAHLVANLGSWDLGTSVGKLAFSPDGALLGTANNRDWVRYSRYRFFSGLWQVQAGRLQRYLLGHTRWVYDVAFSPDGRLFGSVSDDGSVMLWQVADGKLVRKIEGSQGTLASLAFSPNNLLLATASLDGYVGLWEVSNGNLLRTLRANEYSLEDVSFSPDGALLAAASDDNSIYLWQVGDGNLVRTFQGHSGPVKEVVFSPDGSQLASASEDRTVRIWQFRDGSLLRNLSGLSEAVYTVAFSPDGTLLVSGSGDGTLCLWQVSDGALLSTLVGHSYGIHSLAFSPDGHLLASGDDKGVVKFWGISEAIKIINK